MSEEHDPLSDENQDKTSTDADSEESLLDFDPYDVEIGDALASSDSKYAIWFFVSDVDPDNQRVEVYSGTMAQTVWRWVDIDEFTVHSSNEDVQTDEDRVEWLNTLPQSYRFTEDGERLELNYVITDGDEFELQPTE